MLALPPHGACTRSSPKQDILSSILLYGQWLYYLNIISALTTLQILQFFIKNFIIFHGLYVFVIIFVFVLIPGFGFSFILVFFVFLVGVVADFLWVVCSSESDRSEAGCVIEYDQGTIT
jgi:hypothetical protein